MKRARQYFYGALTLGLCTLCMRTVGVAFNSFCVREIGKEAMGLYSLVMSVYSFAVTFATSGVGLAATRLCALHFGRGEKKELRGAMRACLLYAALFGSAATLAVFFFSRWIAAHLLLDLRAAASLRALSLSLLPLSLSSAYAGYFSAVRRVWKSALSGVFEQAVKILATTLLLAALSWRGIAYACLALVLGGSVGEIVSFLAETAVYLADARHLSRDCRGFPLAATAQNALPVAGSAYVRSGLVTLEHILIPIGLAAYGDSAALATYGVVTAAALPLVLYPSAFIGAFSGLLIPEVTEMDAAKNKTGIAYVGARAVSVTVWFSILCAGAFCTFPLAICRAVYKSGDAAIYLRLLAPLMPVMFADTAVDAMLKGLGAQVYVMFVNIADAGVSALLVWLLVPRLGVMGYILVIYLSETVNTVLSFSRLLSLLPMRVSVWRWMLAPLLSAAAAGNLARLCFFGVEAGGAVPQLLAALLVYIGLYLLFSRLFGVFSAGEWAWLKNIFSRGKKTVCKAE